MLPTFCCPSLLVPQKRGAQLSFFIVVFWGLASPFQPQLVGTASSEQPQAGAIGCVPVTGSQSGEQGSD